MAFRDIRLDDSIERGAQGGPDWEPIAVVMMESGDESREGTKDEALGKWIVSFPPKDSATFAAFLDFFYIVAGREHSFPFKDYLDFACTTAQSHLTALTSSTWQMCKRRSLGGYTYDQKIILPITAGVSIAGGGTYSVARATGIISKSGGADPTTFSCEFDKLVRFDDGHLVQTLEQRAGGQTWASYAGIAIKEIPLTSA